jgi:hypothetical protein
MGLSCLGAVSLLHAIAWIAKGSLLAICITFPLAMETASAEVRQTNRPVWSDSRPGDDSAADATELDAGKRSSGEDHASEPADVSEPLAADRSVARTSRTPISEVSVRNPEPVQGVVVPYPDNGFGVGGSAPSHWPPNESLSFDVGVVCPPPCSEPREFVWGSLDYLLWWSRGHYVPPLVTTGTVASLGVLGQPGTEILFGARSLNGSANSGGRLELGWWLAPEWAVEGNVLWLADMQANYNVSSTGDPLLARPFTNIVTGLADSHIVAFPGTVAGSLSISSTSRFRGGEILLRRTIHSQADCRFDAVDRYSCRWDILLGYRFNRLDDDLMIRESLEAAGPSTIELYDLFDTNNDFHGVDMGLNAVFRHNRWSLELLAKMALGNIRSRVWIDGATVTTSGGVVDNDVGGMLALATNIGSYTENNMAVIPELGVNLGFDITKRCRATFGYTFIYWSNVARAGSQIDQNLNPSYFPNNGPIAGGAQPEFTLITGDYWAQGMNFGLELHF